MMSSTLRVQSFSIVCLGQFTPAIFHPTWFKTNNLLGEKEVDVALERQLVIHRDITIFSTEWLQVEVKPERLMLRTTQAAFTETLRDLAVSILKLLIQTPILALGINQDAQYELESEKEWHRRGHTWAPKEMWNKVLKNPGTRSLTIQGERTDDLKGYILVRVEPTPTPPGIYIDINDHFDVQPIKDQTSANNARDLVQDHWLECLNRGNQIIDAILKS